MKFRVYEVRGKSLGEPVRGTDGKVKEFPTLAAANVCIDRIKGEPGGPWRAVPCNDKGKKRQ